MIKSFIKFIIRVRVLYSFVMKLRNFNIIVHHGGMCSIKNGAKITGNSQIRFNVSQYKNGYHKQGNISMGENSIIELENNGKVTIYSGCKIDVFNNAKLIIGNDVFINECSRIGVKNYVFIGSGSVIGDETSIHDFDGHRINGIEGIKPIIIGHNVWIGEKVTILKGVNIGNNVIIGAGSIVTHDIPDNVIAVGNPVRIIKKLENWS